MPKRSREDSPSPPLLLPSPTPDPSTPVSTDAPVHSSKYIQTSPQARTGAVMKCSLPPHDTLDFSTFEEFEIHYSKVHAYRCSECRKNFPTEHFLGLHISENHDPLSEARRAKGEKTYKCFVEGCDKVCSTPQKRRMHLTDKHMFPKNYDFLIVNTGIDKRSSMLRVKQRRHSSAASKAFRREQRSNGVEDATTEGHLNCEGSRSPAPVTKALQGDGSAQGSQPSQAAPDADVEELTSNMSSLKFVPPSVRFGRGGRRGGLSRS